MILSQEHQPGAHHEPANIALEPNIDLRWVSCVIDQGLIFDPLRKRKGQKFTDLNIEKVMLHSKKLLSNLTQKTLNLHSLVTKRYLKWKKLYNSHNYVVYVLKKMKCLRKDYFAKLKPFPCWNLVESNTKVNAEYYCNVLLKNTISEMNRLVKQNEYLLMQGWARVRTAKLTLDMSKHKKQEPQITGASSVATE